MEELPSKLAPTIHLKLVPILEIADPAILAIAKSVLEDAGIEYDARGEGIQDLFGAGRLGIGYNPLIGPISIQVREEDEKEARRLLDELLSS